MIILNDFSNKTSETLAEQMKETARENLDFRMKKIIIDFNRQVKYHALNGSTEMNYILREKVKGFITNEMILFLDNYIVDNGFTLEYDYVSEQVEGDEINFHKFNVKW